MQEEGVVSGGNYTHASGCISYPFPPCAVSILDFIYLIFFFLSTETEKKKAIFPFVMDVPTNQKRVKKSVEADINVNLKMINIMVDKKKSLD